MDQLETKLVFPGLTPLEVHGEEVADLLLERRWNTQAKDVNGLGEGGPHRCVEGVNLLGGERRALPERAEPGGVQDLVAVGVPDAGHKRLVAQEGFELTRMAPVSAMKSDSRRRRRCSSYSSAVATTAVTSRPKPTTLSRSTAPNWCGVR